MEAHTDTPCRAEGRRIYSDAGLSDSVYTPASVSLLADSPPRSLALKPEDVTPAFPEALCQGNAISFNLWRLLGGEVPLTYPQIGTYLLF